MRICHVTPHVPPDQAANALLPAELARWAAAEGFSVNFVAHEAAQTTADRTVNLAGPVAWVPRRGAASGLSRLLRIDSTRRARQIMGTLDEAARDATLLHLHSNGLLIEVAAAWARRRQRPYLLTLYGTEIWHYRRRWPIDPFARAYQGARAVTFYSQGLLDHARAAGLSRANLEVVYPAVREIFRPRSDEARRAAKLSLGVGDATLVLNVKRLHALAAQHVLIDAFARVAAGRAVRLVICGTGPERAALEARAAASGVGDRISFAGLVANDRVAEYAAAADVFALPSDLEAMPTVAVEALASGTPVVSTDHPGGRELQALFGADVSVVPRGDSAAFAAAMAPLLAEPRRVRPETLDRVAEWFGPAAVWQRYRALYDRALGVPRPE